MDDVKDAEVVRLRARVAELEGRLSASEAQSHPIEPEAEHSRRRGRATLSAILIVLACLLAPLSVTAVWASTQVSDTEEYVRTVAPLADDPDVQQALAAEITTVVLENVNVERVTSQLLETLAAQDNVPPRVAALIPGLAGPLVNGVEGFTRTQVERVLASDQFLALWAQVNRAAHEQLVALLEGDPDGAVSAQGDTVTLNLAPIIERVKEVLVGQGFTLAENIPAVNRSFTLVESDAVTKVQGFYRLLNALGVWLPLIALALFAAGVALAADRRRALVRGGIGVVASMLLLGVALAVARTLYVQSTPADILTEAAAGNVFDTLVRYLRTGLRASAVLFLIIAMVAFLTGPSSAATGARSVLGRGIGGLRGGAEAAGWNSGRFGVWVYGHRRALLLTVLLVGGLVLLFWTRPTAWVIVITALVMALMAGIIEFLARPPATSAGVHPALAADLPVPAGKGSALGA
jgi:hypothetical protein